MHCKSRIEGDFIMEYLKRKDMKILSNPGCESLQLWSGLMMGIFMGCTMILMKNSFMFR